MFQHTYKADGVRLVPAFGTDYPEEFAGARAEYDAIVGGVALIDLTHWGALRLTGGDRVPFFNNMVTADISKLAAGEAAHALMTTLKGKLVAELFVLARADELFVVVAQGDREAVVGALEKHIIADDVVLKDVSEQVGVLSVEGPRCRDMVWRLFPEEPIPMEALRFIECDYQGMPTMILRNSVCGGRGFQLIVGREHVERIRNYIVQGGRGIDLVLAGRAAWNARRVENGLPWFGADAGPDNFPKETRLDDAVDYEKGCYLGQETLARMHYRGHPNWLLVGVTPSAQTPPEWRDRLDLGERVPAGTELFVENEPDKAAGRITSAVFSPQLDAPLALAMVRAKTVESGTKLRVNDDAPDIPSEWKIIELPLRGEDE